MLVYDQPIGQAKPDRQAPRTSVGFSVLELARLLWQRRVAIAAFRCHSNFVSCSTLKPATVRGGACPASGLAWSIG